MIFNLAGVAICVAIVKTLGQARAVGVRARRARARARVRRLPPPRRSHARARLLRAVLMRYLGLDDDVLKPEPAAQSASADAAQAKQEKLEAKKASKAEIKAAGGNPKKKGKAD